MSDDLLPRMNTSGQVSLGDRIRGLADQLRQEQDIQIKATSRIMGAAAAIAQNHDHLIDEVVDMVEEDLERQDNSDLPLAIGVEQLKEQFPRLKDAKAHFNIKANSWNSLAEKLNKKSAPTRTQGNSAQPAHPSTDISQRLETIETKLANLQGDMSQIKQLLTVLVENL